MNDAMSIVGSGRTLFAGEIDRRRTRQLPVGSLATVQKASLSPATAPVFISHMVSGDGRLVKGSLYKRGGTKESKRNCHISVLLVVGCLIDWLMKQSIDWSIISSTHPTTRLRALPSPARPARMFLSVRRLPYKKPPRPRPPPPFSSLIWSLATAD